MLLFDDAIVLEKLYPALLIISLGFNQIKTIAIVLKKNFIVRRCNLYAIVLE